MVIIMVGAMWNYRKSRKINPSRKRYGKKVKVGDKYIGFTWRDGIAFFVIICCLIIFIFFR